MSTPAPNEDTATIAGALAHISTLPRAEQHLRVAELALDNPEVMPDRLVGIAAQHGFRVPDLWRDASFTWALYHALRRSPAPLQARQTFSAGVGRSVLGRATGSRTRMRAIAELRVLYGPFIEEYVSDPRDVAYHPMLDGPTQQDFIDLLKLATVILPHVRDRWREPRPTVIRPAVIRRTVVGGGKVVGYHLFASGGK